MGKLHETSFHTTPPQSVGDHMAPGRNQQGSSFPSHVISSFSGSPWSADLPLSCVTLVIHGHPLLPPFVCVWLLL